MDTTTKTRIVQNTVFVLIAQITNIFLQMVYLVIAARYLGNVQFGKLSFAMAFTQMFLAVTDLGLFNYAVRGDLQEKGGSPSVFYKSFCTKITLGNLCFNYHSFYNINFKLSPDTIITTYLLSLGLCLFSLNTTFHAVFQSYERLQYISITMILFFIVNVLLGIIALLMGKNIITLACINCIAGIVVFITNLFILCKKFLFQN